MLKQGDKLPREKSIRGPGLNILQAEVQDRPILEGKQSILSRIWKNNLYQVDLYTYLSDNYLNPPLTTRKLRETVELLRNLARGF